MDIPKYRKLRTEFAAVLVFINVLPGASAD